MRLLPLLLVLAATLTAARPVSAEEPNRAAARQHYERGIALASAADYAGALAEFRQAYDQSPHFAVLYNIGQAEAMLGHPVEAIEALTRYLEGGADQVPEPRQREVRAQLLELDARLAELTVTTDHAGIAISVDGKELGRTPLERPVRLAPGRHEITTTDAERSQTMAVFLGEAERRTLSLTMPRPLPILPVVTPAPPPPAPPPPPAAPPPPAERSSSKKGTRTILGYGLAGAGLAVEGAALAHYLWNRGRYEEWQTAQATLDHEKESPDYRERQIANNELAASIEGASQVTVALTVGGAALALGGVALVLTDKEGKEDPPRQAGLLLSPVGGVSAGVWATW